MLLEVIFLCVVFAVVVIGSRYIRFIYFCVEDTGNFFLS